ncbi:hypothetical protein QIS74_06367 [Colletotrichum tabaci]|uniref:Uncharacterized protein n=1 Tax=Colletotrichum tabaci TaxID=1209068 RepID=A0AAV9TEK3_9PEZI
MRFTNILTAFSCIASALAAKYILVLNPTTDIESFSAKLAQDSILVVSKFPLFNILVVQTYIHDIAALESYPEVSDAEVDQIVTIGPVIPPVPLPSPLPDSEYPEVPPVPLPSPLPDSEEPEVPPVPLPSPLPESEEPEVPPVPLPSPLPDSEEPEVPPVPLPSPLPDSE